jgi:hypothetical protein
MAVNSLVFSSKLDNLFDLPVLTISRDASWLSCLIDLTASYLELS